MDDETARQMDRLLAGGKLSGPEADALLERIHATLAREGKPRPVRAIRKWAGAAGAALAAAAAVLLVVYLPHDPGDQRVHQDEEGVMTPRLAVRCSGGTLLACPASSDLVFSLRGERTSGFLSAYAEPVGHDAERVFYFSNQDGSVELALPADGSRVSERAVRMPEAQKPGRYLVHAIIASRPIGREELVRAAGRQGDAEATVTARVELVVTE